MINENLKIESLYSTNYLRILYSILINPFRGVLSIQVELPKNTKVNTWAFKLFCVIYNIQLFICLSFYHISIGILLTIPLFFIRHYFLSQFLEIFNVSDMATNFLNFLDSFRNYIVVSIGSFLGLRSSKEVAKAVHFRRFEPLALGGNSPSLIS